MAKHYREIIREYIVNELKNKTAAENRVFDSRLLPFLDTDKYPALCVYTLLEENGDQAGGTSFRERRDITVSIEAICLGTEEDWASQLDNLCREIQSVMDGTYVVDPATGKVSGDDKLGGNVQSLTYLGTEINTQMEANRPICVAVVKYHAVKYLFQ